MSSILLDGPAVEPVSLAEPKPICDAWPASGRIPVVPAPLRALVAVRIIKLDGATQAIDVGAFAVDAISAPAVLAFAAARCRRRVVWSVASSSTSKSATATRPATCRSRCARRSACWSRTGTRTAG